MSIIHDALKIKISGRRADRKITVLVFLFFFTAVAYLSFYHFKAQRLLTPYPVATQKRLHLNGVFVSDRLRVAMINRHIYHQGEKVNGMKITAIELNRVSLDRDGTQLILSVAQGGRQGDVS